MTREPTSRISLFVRGMNSPLCRASIRRPFFECKTEKAIEAPGCWSNFVFVHDNITTKYYRVEVYSNTHLIENIGMFLKRPKKKSVKIIEGCGLSENKGY